MSLGGFGALWHVLLVLVGGWLSLQSRLLGTFTWSESGYNLYFKIAVAGLLCFLACLVAITVLILCSTIILSCSGEHHESLRKFFAVFFQCHEEIFMISSWATPFMGLLVFFVSSLWTVARKRPLANTRLAKMRLASIARKNEFERLVMGAIETKSLLLVTLDNRKTYVGWPVKTFNFSQPDTAKKHLRITPLMSGYRAKSNMNLAITTDYLAALSDDSLEHEEYLAVVIPVGKIASLQHFDLNLYELFQQHQSPHGSPATP